jgi:hypothetical protein
MKNTELVRHVVEKELLDYPEITEPDVASSISTKFADPRLGQVNFSPKPLRSLAEILADSMQNVNWEQTNVTDQDDLYAQLLTAVLEAYQERNPTERDKNVDENDPHYDHIDLEPTEETTNTRTTTDDDIIEGDAEGIGEDTMYFNDDSDGSSGPTSTINSR